jgi:hypothetical protein
VLAKLAKWVSSPENFAQLAEMAREFHSIPRMGSAQEPVYACPGCVDGNGRILAFRTKEEESAHFAGKPHSKGEPAGVGVLVVESLGPLARKGD